VCCPAYCRSNTYHTYTLASIDTTYDEVVLRPKGKSVIRNESLCMADAHINELIENGVTSSNVTFDIRNGYMFGGVKTD
jgi:hypothetical protein